MVLISLNSHFMKQGTVTQEDKLGGTVHRLPA